MSLPFHRKVTRAAELISTCTSDKKNDLFENRMDLAATFLAEQLADNRETLLSAIAAIRNDDDRGGAEEFVSDYESV
jgi:hypothetical protein